MYIINRLHPSLTDWPSHIHECMKFNVTAWLRSSLPAAHGYVCLHPQQEEEERMCDGGGAEVMLELDQCYLKKVSGDLQHIGSYFSVFPPPLTFPLNYPPHSHLCFFNHANVFSISCAETTHLTVTCIMILFIDLTSCCSSTPLHSLG